MGDHRVLQGESLEAFNEGISHILNRWSAVRTAIDSMWGGNNSYLKAQELIDDVCSWFAQNREPFYIDDLTTFIHEGMSDAFDLEINDGSNQDIAGTLLFIREECLNGDFRNIESLRDATQIPNFYPRMQEFIEFPLPPPEDTDRQNITCSESSIVDGTSANNSDSETNSESVNQPN